MAKVSMKVNGNAVEAELEDRTLLVDFLRNHLNLTGTHVGCDTSQCGACLIHLDGKSVKSCTMLAAQASGSEIITIEGIAGDDELHPMQAAFKQHHALQCGFCTPGMIMSAIDIVNSHNANGNGQLTQETIRHELEGNLCRCTGYHNIIKAIAAGAKNMSKR